jgi:tetratricopeptide (TPR) repeat protein
MFVYDSTLRVPLLLSWPGELPAGLRVAGQFRSVDLLPTVLDLLGSPAVPTSGLSRATELRRGRRLPANESYAETLFGNLHFGYAPVRALRAEGWKYIAVPRAELYDLREDPGELRNLIAARGSDAARLAGQLHTYDRTGGAAPTAPPVDAGTMERLAALGYLSGGVPRPADTGVDPKDRIAEYQAHTRSVQQAVRLYSEGKLDEALPLLERLWRSKVASLEIGFYYGMALFRRGRWAEATKPLEEALSLVPRWTMLYVNLSNAYWELGRKDDAVAIIERGLRLEPRSPTLLRSRGVLRHRRGDLAGARSALEQAVAADPRDSTTRIALSAVFRDTGAIEESLAQLREGVRVDPKDGDAWNALGVMLRRAGRAGALFNLAGVRLAEGRAAEARALLERVVATAPAFPGARAALEETARRSQPLPAGQIELRLLRFRDRATAEGATRRLAAGADFAGLARAESVDPSAPAGGYVGVVRLEDLAEPLRSAAAALGAGGLSSVLETPEGFVVLRRDR